MLYLKIKKQVDVTEIRYIHPNWSGLRDLNPRSLGPKPSAIPNFAKPGYCDDYSRSRGQKQEDFEAGQGMAPGGRGASRGKGWRRSFPGTKRRGIRLTDKRGSCRGRPGPWRLRPGVVCRWKAIPKNRSYHIEAPASGRGLRGRWRAICAGMRWRVPDMLKYGPHFHCFCMFFQNSVRMRRFSPRRY